MGVFFAIAIPIAVLATFLALAVGVGGFARGGAFNARNGNKLMQLRVLLQAVALAFVALAMLFGGR